jgi:hypothetical protein
VCGMTAQDLYRLPDVQHIRNLWSPRAARSPAPSFW